MKFWIYRIVFLFAIFFLPFSATAGKPVHHNLKVVLNPEKHKVSVEDSITVPERLLPTFQFYLHKGLKPSSPTQGVHIEYLSSGSKGGFAESFRVILPPGQDTFIIRYAGDIYHPLESYGKEYARGFRSTPGVISEKGVYLAGRSLWYPDVEGQMVTFTLKTELPKTWEAVSQGARSIHVRETDKNSVQWESPESQDEIFLIAGQFIEYVRNAGRVDAMVFLRTEDEDLATRYLDATVSYIAMYEELIGQYPYRKFALVENFWETGFGMPSFTLLGPKIIRFPFILHSSYPHEILHNWWGNSVYPDYSKGNWAEGLTAYLSDHLIKEQRGKGAEYRQGTLQKYLDYVLSGRDFPVAQFRARHSTSSEAVGYGKSLMFFHMLRREIGDKIFRKGLQDFYRSNRFSTASFDDLRRSFENVSGKDLEKQFDEWINHAGAPQLKIIKFHVEQEDAGYMLTVFIEQVQSGRAYHLKIPVSVTMEKHESARQVMVPMKGNRVVLKLHLPARPLRADIDPEFDIFRRLDREEIPPALSQAFGAKRMLIILPSSAREDLLRAYRDLSGALGQSGPDKVEVKLDTEIAELPDEYAVTLLGWENRFFGQVMSSLSGYDVNIEKESAKIGRIEIPKKNHSVVLTSRHPGNRDVSLTWIATDVPEAVPGLGRKLPHYHKYSYLGFEGDEPSNIAKGRWPVIDSPMTLFIPLDDGSVSHVEMGTLNARRPLIDLPPAFSKQRMIETVRFLSSEKLRGRGFGTEGLDRAADFIAGKFKEAGLKPLGDYEESYFQTWEEQGRTSGQRVTLKNVIGFIPGNKTELKEQSVVVGAHYDHLGLGWPEVREEKYRDKIHPGADDNASGIAVLLELARVLGKNMKPDRSVVFVAFTGEEAGKRGSKYYVSNMNQYPPEQCIGMLNIDTVGRLGKKKLLVLGAGSAREWVHIFRGSAYVTGVDVEVIAEELDSSDQKSFQNAGIPAVQLFSGPHLDYHRPSDTAEKIDPDGLVKVASVAKEVIEYLSRREEPMTNTGVASGDGGSFPKKVRRVSLGTVPDFAFSGKGCRLSGVVPDSPAEACGLREGDIIVKINAEDVFSLKDLSDILKSLSPGDRVSITFLRDGRKMTAEAEVVGR